MDSHHLCRLSRTHFRWTHHNWVLLWNCLSGNPNVPSRDLNSGSPWTARGVLPTLRGYRNPHRVRAGLETDLEVLSRVRSHLFADSRLRHGADAGVAQMADDAEEARRGKERHPLPARKTPRRGSRLQADGGRNPGPAKGKHQSQRIRRSDCLQAVHIIHPADALPTVQRRQRRLVLHSPDFRICQKLSGFCLGDHSGFDRAGHCHSGEQSPHGQSRQKTLADGLWRMHGRQPLCLRRV